MPVDVVDAAGLQRVLDRLSRGPPERPTLVYLDIMGIGWPIRALFRVAGAELDDVRVPFGVWAGGESLQYIAQVAARKKTFGPFKHLFKNGHIPRYVDGDVDINQSLVILEYLGRKYGLLGDSPQEELAIKEVCIHGYDSLFHFSGMFNINKVDVPQEIFKQRLEGWLADTGINGWRKNLTAFQNYLRANTTGSGFMVGSRLSVADLQAFNVLCNWYKSFARKQFTDQYPDLDAYIGRIARIPAVASYIPGQAATTWLPGNWGKALGYKLTTPQEARGLIPRL